MERGERLI